MEICPKCGLPKQACVCDQIAKSEQHIKVSIVKKRYGKVVTQVSGLEKGMDIKQIVKSLKNELACGGTYDQETGLVELQGDHHVKIKPILVRLGFDEDSIEN